MKNGKTGTLGEGGVVLSPASLSALGKMKSAVAGEVDENQSRVSVPIPTLGGTMSSRNVIPVDFSEELIAQLKAEANAMGLKTATYIRTLVVTHPNRAKAKPVAKKGGSKK